jgi:hypothetical protein
VSVAWRLRLGTAALAVLGVALGLVAVTWASGREDVRAGNGPPPPGGYFETVPVGAWRTLPDDATCAGRVHRSSWEPRPGNFQPNHRMPVQHDVHRAFRARPRALMGAYDKRWDSWLLPRVDGQFTGTTDEIIQWAACKWGLSDDLLRAIAVRESNWYQGEVYPDGSCVVAHGCGDLLTERLPGGRTYCRMLARTVAPADVRYDPHECPRTFSIVGVMSWQEPSWGRMPHNQNGTFPFNRDSTAFAFDYVGAFLRGCTEGWMPWLHNTGPYRRGDLTGCVGVWYGGAWRSRTARQYIARVESVVADRTWLDAAWARESPPCDPEHGCPLAAP